MLLEKILQGMFRFGSFFLFVLAIIHIFDIRFGDVNLIWPQDALIYSKLLSRLFGSFSLILAILAWEVSNNLKKYQKLVILTAWWGIFHALLEIFSALTNPYNELFSQNPSIKVWIPQYNYNLILEAILLIIYAFVVFLWIRRKDD
jgi:hypothetical protein